MRKLIAILGLVFVWLIIPAKCSAQSNFEVFGGYSFLYPQVSQPEIGPCPFASCPVQFASNRATMSGLEFSGIYKPSHWFGLTADFSADYGNVQGISEVHIQTYMAGPQISLPGPVSPFAHILIGGAHQSTTSGETSSGGVFTTASASSVAGAAGVGIDIKIFPHIAIRAIQFDYLLTHFNSSTQNEPRVAAGVVIAF
ncbi:MAG: hypothetical protein WA734_16505 [Candidatus Acidiferrales bacterium]